MKPGIYDISNEEYHASPGISRSGIMEFKKTPYHYWHRYINPNRTPEKQTKAKEFGSAFHPYILEPHLFERDFAFEDTKIDGRTTDGKRLRKEFEEKNQGKTILKYDEYHKLLGMTKSVNNNQTIVDLISGAQYEKSIYWIDPDTQMLCKCRPDILHENKVCDLKSTSSASEDEFQRSIYKYGYHIQAAMMQEAIYHVFNNVIDYFVFIPVEKEEPYMSAVYPLNELSIEQGRAEFKKALKDYKRCLETNAWPGYPTKWISLPSWAFKEKESITLMAG